MTSSVVCARYLQLLSAALLSLMLASEAQAQNTITMTVQAGEAGKTISPDLIGVFFEDLSHAGDGGLYGELVQNRSFEHSATEQPSWNNLSFWSLTRLGSSKGDMAIEAAAPVHPNNPHYAVLELQEAGDGIAMSNSGYEGIPVQAGEHYELSLFAKQLYFGQRWGARSSGSLPLNARLESPDGHVLAQTTFDIAQREWQRFGATLTASRSEPAARLVLVAKVPGGIGLDMDDYVQEVLDLIEYANGPVTSRWGALRAAAGHPEPFNLEYLGVGNEDHITFLFQKRFEMIYEAVKARHPQITVIGTVGPSASGDDFDQGWRIANELAIPIVDEHYYVAPQWFWDHLDRYDTYDRSKSKVYLGEYAAHDEKRRSTLRAALADAAHLTSLERNGDVVLMASYAPLLAREGFLNWTPNLIYFNGATGVFPTISYEVQRLFSLNSGDRYLDTTLVGGGKENERLAASSVRDSGSGDVILKIVNGDGAPKTLQIELEGARRLPRHAEVTVLAGEADQVNDYASNRLLKPRTSTIPVASTFSYSAPPNSLTVLRIKGKGK